MSLFGVREIYREAFEMDDVTRRGRVRGVRGLGVVPALHEKPSGATAGRKRQQDDEEHAGRRRFCWGCRTTSFIRHGCAPRCCSSEEDAIRAPNGVREESPGENGRSCKFIEQRRLAGDGTGMKQRSRRDAEERSNFGYNVGGNSLKTVKKAAAAAFFFCGSRLMLERVVEPSGLQFTESIGWPLA